eukprot:scaffold5233_cov22-Tisochrysis_lutea.AAC.1
MLSGKPFTTLITGNRYQEYRSPPRVPIDYFPPLGEGSAQCSGQKYPLFHNLSLVQNVFAACNGYLFLASAAPA